jgi:alkanesulfonate monooxygenase SsuD/methylene tetrahydromethanopterin reductase-like flavin-dependent oxidoreductase (luciferase family)
VEFGFCYLSDYHADAHGSFADWYARLQREWRLIDQLEFDAIWIAEHRYPGYGFSSTPVVAQAMASATTNVKIGTAVALLSQRHPILLAEDWAAVDLLSGGRLQFGIGRGIYNYDFDVLGIPSGESRERFEEAWEVVRRLWTEDEVTHSGKHWAFEKHRLGPRPLQQPHPPVFVGCVASPESYVWAGENGYNVIVAPFLLDSTERQAEYLERYRCALQAAGHDPVNFQVVANYHLAIATSDAQLNDADTYFYRYLDFLARTSNPRRLDVAGYRSYQRGGGLYADLHEMREKRSVMGTPQECIDRIGELSKACGLTGWMFHINYGGVPEDRVVEELHVLKERVIPAFAT